MKALYIILFIIYLCLTKVYAQFSDSLRISVATTTTVATKHYQPLWIVSNRYGTITDRKTDISSHIRVLNNHYFTGNSKQEASKGFFIKYGADLYNNNHFKQFFIKEAFLKTGYKYWEIRGGRYEDIIGEVDPALSSGSFGISNNAIPIPKIGIAVNEYLNVPFTKGWLQFKGQFSHGWLGNSNYLKGAFLHQKSLYLKIGKNRLQF